MVPVQREDDGPGGQQKVGSWRVAGPEAIGAGREMCQSGDSEETSCLMAPAVLTKE